MIASKFRIRWQFANSRSNISLLYPAERFASMIGRAPEIAPDLRLLVMDDQSMKAAHHMPTINDLIGVAKRLFAAGYETVLISGVMGDPAAWARTAPRRRDGAAS